MARVAGWAEQWQRLESWFELFRTHVILEVLVLALVTTPVGRLWQRWRVDPTTNLGKKHVKGKGLL